MSRVLVVEDEVQMREQLYDALVGKGYVVSTAGTGEQAIELMKAQRPELVVVDMTLPKLSGIQLAERIRRFDDAIPIVLWRCANDMSVAEDELNLWAIADVVHKEWEVPQILDRIEKAMQTTTRMGLAASSKAAGMSGTLLVIDDDPQVRDLLKLFFTTKGLSVVVANSGEEGIKALAKKPTLILLDVNMPGMDGVMALKKIKAAAPELPVVVMSGGGEGAMAQAALKLGAHDYITKPFNLEYLETVVLTKVLLGFESGA